MDLALGSTMSRKDELVQPHNISDSLMCPICIDILQEPVFYGGRPCQHVFCRVCVDTALQRRQECPICRGKIRGKDVQQKHLVLSCQIDELHLRCKRTCGWVGRNDAREEHMKTCPIVLFENLRADFTVTQSFMDSEIRGLRRTVSEKDAIIATLLDSSRQMSAAIAQKDDVIATLRDESLRNQLTLAELEQRVHRERPYQNMQICVKTLTGKAIALDVQRDSTTKNVKEKLEEHAGIPVLTQRLSFEGFELDDDYPLAHYNIEAASTVHLCPRIRVPSCSSLEENVPMIRMSSESLERQQPDSKKLRSSEDLDGPTKLHDLSCSPK